MQVPLDGSLSANKRHYAKGRIALGAYSSGVGRLVELQVSGEDLALRLALRSVDAGRGAGRG
jgi:hypothetical protein